MGKPFFTELLFFGLIHLSVCEEVTFNLGSLGPITGLTTQTKVYPDAPHSGRPYYKFRNLPYNEGSISGSNRFKQSSVRVSPYSTDQTQPYDAIRSGPLCMQGTLGSVNIPELLNLSLEDFLLSLLPEDIGGLVPRVVVEVLLAVIEILVEVPTGTLGGKKPVVDILHDWLDIDLSVSEECLHLAVWTPTKPDGEARENLPVMFYLHGGGFNSGFSYRMGGERLGAFEDVVVVAINYRLGPLGFLCLDTEEAAGNMGLLDQVVALEWVQQYISYFGGDPTRVTLFGHSAGSASTGHLMLSSESSGLFSQAIGSSGSAIASWAFQTQSVSEGYSREIAAKVLCVEEDPDTLVACLREVPADFLSAAYSTFQGENRGRASMGFEGTQPCGQTKGPRFFYSAEQTPTDILFSGKYDALPIMYGTTKDEGTLFFGTIYNEFILKNNMTEDTHFLTNEALPLMLETTFSVTNYYAMKELLMDAYFDPWMIGNLNNMAPGITDLLSVFVIKAPSYEFVQENSKHAPSYLYAFHYDSPQKHLLNVFSIGSKKLNGTHPGATHCESVPYLFDVEVPLIFCDLEEMINDALHCFDGLDAIFCLTLASGEFRTKWHDCLTGELSEEELRVSANTAGAWASFAAKGYPGSGLGPWSKENPQYLKIDIENTLKQDYVQEYHTAGDHDISKESTL